MEKQSKDCPLIQNLADFNQRINQLALDRNIDLALHPSWEDLHNPLEMKGMPESVIRIEKAIKNKERIMIFGDFDADGITSTACFYQGLKDLGAEVSYRIPNRNTDSHGLKNHLIEEILQTQTTLLISCDCGINDHEAVAYAYEKGLEVIITDHHQSVAEKYPQKALAVINPHQQGCPYPEKNLSGVGIVFKILQALNPDPRFLEKYLELVAIGQIADCVPLKGEVRNLCLMGMEQLTSSQWQSLQYLLREKSIDPKSLDESFIGFTIAPLLNAASRMGDANKALQFILGHTPHLALLETMNDQRKKDLLSALEEAEEQIREKSSCQILIHPSWSVGILGLIASKIAEKTQQPTFALRLEKNIIKCSARAPKGSSIVQAFQAFPEIFEKAGGHDGAGGFMIDPSQLTEAQQKLRTFYLQNPPKYTPLIPDGSIQSPLDFKIFEKLDQLRPFGVENPEPCWQFSRVEILDILPLGRSGEHFKIIGKTPHQTLDFMAFFVDQDFHQIHIGACLEIKGLLQKNQWNGQQRVQVKIQDYQIYPESSTA